MVLSAPAETTVPGRSCRRPRSCSGFGRRVIGLRSADGTRLGRVFFGRSERGSRFFLGFGPDTAAAVSAGASAASTAPASSAGGSSASTTSSASAATGSGSSAASSAGASDSSAAGSSASAGGSASASTTGSASAPGAISSAGASLSVVSSISVFSVSSAISSVPSFTLVLDGQDARDLALGVAQARAVLEHAGRRLEVQVEELLTGLGHPAVELVVGHGPQLSSSQRDQPPCGRTSS